MKRLSPITQQPVQPDRLLRAQELRREMTPAERKLWEQLRANRLGGFHFRRQQILGYYFADFYCHEAALVVELDGEIHQEQQEYDRERELGLQALGLRVIRFSNEAIFQDFRRVLKEILRTCNSVIMETEEQ